MAARAGVALLDRLLRRVEVFGFHLAALDARQDAEVHRRVVGELLEDPGFAESDGSADRAHLGRSAGARSRRSEPTRTPRPR